MKSNWRKKKATQYKLWELFQLGVLPADALEHTDHLLGYVPTKDNWRTFIDRMLLSSGTIFLIAGIFFFFAFNWSDLEKLERFALLEGAVVLSVVLAYFLNINSWSGRMALAAAALLVGPTMGVIGQAYQTGADSYSLFMNWTILVTGWVLISQWNIMWLIWMILINLTIGLYWEQIIGGQLDLLILIIALINTGFVLTWDTVTKKTWIQFMQKGRWFLYFPVLAAFGATTFGMVGYIVEFSNPDNSFGPVTLATYTVLLLITGFAYSGLIRRDLLTFTIASVSVLIVTDAALGRVIYETLFTNTDDPFVFFFLMGVITIGLTTGLARGLRWLHREWEGE